MAAGKGKRIRIEARRDQKITTHSKTRLGGEYPISGEHGDIEEPKAEGEAVRRPKRKFTKKSIYPKEALKEATRNEKKTRETCTKKDDNQN